MLTYPPTPQVIIFVVVVNTFPALRFISSTAGERPSSRGGVVLALVDALVGAYQPLSGLLLLSIYTYLVVYLYLPPSDDTSSVQSGFLRGRR